MTTTISISLEDASLDQIKWHMTNIENMEVHHSSKEGSLIAKLKSLHGEEFDTILAPAPEVANAAVAPSDRSNFNAEDRAVAARLKRSERVTIVVNKGESDPDTIDVGVNGYHYSIKRGVRVEVPMAVVEALKNAVQITYTIDKETGGMIPHESQAVPYSVLG